MSTGSAFQSLGALAANDLSPLSLVLVLGTARSINCHGSKLILKLKTMQTCNNCINRWY